MTTALEPKLARHLESGSDRSFGLVIGAALVVIGSLPLLHAGRTAMVAICNRDCVRDDRLN